MVEGTGLNLQALSGGGIQDLKMGFEPALRILKELEEKYAKREANGAYLANPCCLGEDDRAIAWLEKDFDSGKYCFLAYVTNLTSLHEHLNKNPGYQNLLRRMCLKLGVL